MLVYFSLASFIFLIFFHLSVQWICINYLQCQIIYPLYILSWIRKIYFRHTASIYLFSFSSSPPKYLFLYKNAHIYIFLHKFYSKDLWVSIFTLHYKTSNLFFSCSVHCCIKIWDYKYLCSFLFQIHYFLCALLDTLKYSLAIPHDLFWW